MGALKSIAIDFGKKTLYNEPIVNNPFKLDYNNAFVSNKTFHKR